MINLICALFLDQKYSMINRKLRLLSASKRYKLDQLFLKMNKNFTKHLFGTLQALNDKTYSDLLTAMFNLSVKKLLLNSQ